LNLFERDRASVAKHAPLFVRIEPIPRLNSGFGRIERDPVRGAILLPFHRHRADSMALQNCRGRQHATVRVNTPLDNALIDNAPVNDNRRSARGGAKRGGSRDSTRKLAAADTHASIVEWDTCRKSW